jgi:hypothetical protein
MRTPGQASCQKKMVDRERLGLAKFQEGTQEKAEKKGGLNSFAARSVVG